MKYGTSLFGAALIAVLYSSPATAQQYMSPGGGGAITEHDGSVRANTGIRLSVTHIPNPAGDHAMKIGERVQPRMASVRACHQKAAHGDAQFHGTVSVRLSNTRKASQKVRIDSNDTGSKAFASCIARAIKRAKLKGLPRNATARVSVKVTSPTSAVHAVMAARTRQAAHVDVKRSKGKLQSEGKTQNGEVQFELSAVPKQRAALVDLHHDVSDRLAGLLDCRRRASRRGVTPKGALVFDVKTDGSISNVRTVKNQIRDPKAPRCVEAWLKRAEASNLHAGNVRLTLRYGP